jgi:hypothetical protein
VDSLAATRPGRLWSLSPRMQLSQDAPPLVRRRLLSGPQNGSRPSVEPADMHPRSAQSAGAARRSVARHAAPKPYSSAV